MITKPDKLFIIDNSLAALNSILSRHILAINLDIQLSSTKVTDRVFLDNPVYLQRLNLTPTSADIQFSIAGISFTIGDYNLLPGAVNSIHSDRGCVTVVTPIDGDINLNQAIQLEPYTYRLLSDYNPPENRDCTIELTPDMNFDIIDGVITLSMRRPDILETVSSNALRFINGVPPDDLGNINIISKNSEVTVDVRPIHHIDT